MARLTYVCARQVLRSVALSGGLNEGVRDRARAAMNAMDRVPVTDDGWLKAEEGGGEEEGGASKEPEDDGVASDDEEEDEEEEEEEEEEKEQGGEGDMEGVK